MPRQPIKTHQRAVSRFVLQWLVLQALRYVQWDLSFNRYESAFPFGFTYLEVMPRLVCSSPRDVQRQFHGKSCTLTTASAGARYGAAMSRNDRFANS
jgi:hypothetical protein